jgi:NNP family nitrate/nitrite transporter-like MFS transporter
MASVNKESRMSERTSAIMALVMSTLAFAVCFACWVINGVLMTYLVSTGIYTFNEAQVGWLLALPILMGAVTRVPLGILTDRYGGKRVFTVLMLAVAGAMYLLSLASSYGQFLLASLAFGIAGGSFAVGIGYVSGWFAQAKQGTALGIFGMGNAGAAVTTLVAPYLLARFTNHGVLSEGWRHVPQVYAAVVLVMAVLFFVLTRERRSFARAPQTIAEQLAPLRDIVVWRFGLYYLLVFGAFVSLAQWIVPYSVNVYQLSVIQAGLLASAFSLPSGVIRAAGGWLSDRFGARAVMYWVFLSSIIVCVLLSVPKMHISSPGEGIVARSAGVVTDLSPSRIMVGTRGYPLQSPPTRTPAEMDTGTMFLPQVTRWQEPVVAMHDTVQKKQLLARGMTIIYYPANVWIFAILVLCFGVATGVGKAGVFKFIPEQFPNAVGVVGGMVGLIGALGGFIFPPLFGYLLRGTGLWSSCWIVLVVLAVVCLIWMQTVVRRIDREEAPELVRLIERRPATALGQPVVTPAGGTVTTVEAVLQGVPFFGDLTAEQCKELARIGRMQTVTANTMVVREGDPGDTLYVILDGTVKVSHTDKQGHEVQLAILQAGDFFGELALIDGEPRSAGVTTLSASQFFLIGRHDFLTLVSKSPWMLANLLVGMSTKIRSSLEKVKE